MNRISLRKFDGPDASVITSLVEYGLAWWVRKKDIMFVYGISMAPFRKSAVGAVPYDLSMWKRCRESDDNDYVMFDNYECAQDIDPRKEWNWVPAEFWDDPDRKDLPLTALVYDLYSTYGYENVFGSTYGCVMGISRSEKSLIW